MPDKTRALAADAELNVKYLVMENAYGIVGVNSDAVE
jgi:hypothetical protein